MAEEVPTFDSHAVVTVEKEAATRPNPLSAHHEPPPRDDEGMLLEYDVVIAGTGLVQSILASSLARAGKTVLHCDGSELYGELNAVWTFDIIQKMWDAQQRKMTTVRHEQATRLTSNAFADTNACISASAIHLSPESTTSLQFHSIQTTKIFGIQVGTKIHSPYGNGIIRAFVKTNNHSNEDFTSTMEIELVDWKLANGSSPVVYVKIPSSLNVSDPVALEEHLQANEKIRSQLSIEAQELLQLHRFFALDVTPALILASGPAVEGMLASNVADYLEFKTIEGLYWMESKKNDSNDFELSRIPCSKNDVFGSRLLPPMDKRRLMKFIQLSMDYATSMTTVEELETAELPVVEVEVLSLNERHLNQGRSLARPQNKAVATNELQVLQQCIDDGKTTFDEFLAQNYKLSTKLRSIVRYALAWETESSSSSLERGMTALRQHLQALGRYGKTALLYPMYGSGELPQAFCRSAAVFGATYLLRRAPLAIYSSQVESGEILVQGILLSEDSAQENQTDETIVKDKMIRCSNIVVPTAALLDRSLEQSTRIMRRVSVLKGRVIPTDNGEQRHVLIIPPNTVGNSHAIHGVLLDRSVAVSPYGCTLLHLTTTVMLTNGGYHDGVKILKRAQNAILSSECRGGDVSARNDDPIELYHVSFSHACHQPAQKETLSDKLPKSVHLCSHTGQVLTADVAFEEAKRLFSTICPGTEFFALSDSFDETIRERAQEKQYNDDETAMLESALGMLEEKKETTGSAVSDDTRGTIIAPEADKTTSM